MTTPTDSGSGDLAPDDLIYSLADAIRRGATMAWCVAHASASDPLPEAWWRAEDDFGMRFLLKMSGIDPRFDLRCDGCCDGRYGGTHCAQCVAVIRERYPLMTLDRVLRSVHASRVIR